MSEQRLRDLGREAEELVDLPDLGSLQRRGRALRFRRQVAVVGAAAVVATAGVFLFQDRSTDAPQPATPRSESSTVYPGAQMEDLEAGTYELTPSRDGTEPTVLLTVPEGWNSWEGPNRFDGHREGDSNEEALARSTWVVGVTVLDVQGVATERCQPTVCSLGIDMPYHQTVRAVRDIPGYEATVDRSGGDGLFGHPSTLIRLTPDAAQQECARDLPAVRHRHQRRHRPPGRSRRLRRRRRGADVRRRGQRGGLPAAGGARRARRHPRVGRVRAAGLTPQRGRTERSTPIFSIRCSGLWNSSDQ